MPRSRRVRSRLQPLQGPSGMTFVEVLVTILLLAMVVGGIVPLMTAGQQTFEHARPRQEMVQNARVALDKFIREIRAAQSFTLISATEIAFSMSLGDGTTLPDVRYRLFNNRLEYRRDPAGLWYGLAEKFRSMSVLCFDAAGLTVDCASPSLVRSVQVSLVVMDIDGKIPDITITSRALRQAP